MTTRKEFRDTTIALDEELFGEDETNDKNIAILVTEPMASVAIAKFVVQDPSVLEAGEEVASLLIEGHGQSFGQYVSTLVYALTTALYKNLDDESAACQNVLTGAAAHTIAGYAAYKQQRILERAVDEAAEREVTEANRE